MQNNFGNNNQGGFANNQQGGFQQQNNGGNFQQPQNNFQQPQQQGGNFNNQQQSAPAEMFIDMNEQPSVGFGLLPKGRYNVVIKAAEFAAAKSGNGFGLNLQCEVMDGEYAGRIIFDYYNIQHSNQQAQQIGQRDYAALCKALFDHANPGYREKNAQRLVGLMWTADVDQHSQKKKNNSSANMWGDDPQQQNDEPELRQRITARNRYMGGAQQMAQQPMSNFQQQPQQQQHQQPQNNFQQPQQQGNFQQPQQQGGFQQQPNTGTQIQEQNLTGQNTGGDGALQSGQQTNGFAGNVNQQQQQNNQQQGFNNNGQQGQGFPGGGSSFPQM